tara:strand:- start:53 stop:517 length:465 start_codon:yes stop_codon:yes gene_type:complete
MKKLILLLFIPIVFTCSSDDDNIETFLEKYNGVVWDIDTDGGGAEYSLIAFTNQPQGFIGGPGLEDYCHEVVFGVPYETTIGSVTVTNLVTIIENSQNRLEYEFTELGVGSPFEYSVLYEVIDCGDEINVTYALGDTLRAFNGISTELLITSCN